MKKILIIEDDSIHREQIAEILRFKGFEVFTAEEGKSGVMKARNNEPDLILCDILMPLMNGAEVLRYIRSERDLCHIKFIFVTSLTDRNEIKSGFLMGANDYLTKPFTIKELLAMIDKCFEAVE